MNIMDNIVPIHELQAQRRNAQKQERKNSYQNILLNSRMMHVKDSRLIIGSETKYGTITPHNNLTFAERCSINYINQQGILGSSWKNIK
jgi:hypothetical protein